MNYLKDNISKISYECLLKIEFNSLKSKQVSNWLALLQVEFLFSQGNVEEANKLLNSLPDNPNKKYVSAKYYFSKGSYNKAINMLDLQPKECLVVEDNFNGIKAALDSGANLLKVASVDEVNHINVMKRIDELNKSL